MRRVAPPALIALLLLIVFGYTVARRAPHAGVLSFGHHEWLTAHSLKFARTWWHEGAAQLDWLMVETPRDVEHPTLASRVIYPSYPPGAVLAPYLVAKVIDVEPSVALLMTFNLALHLLIALALSWGVWLFLARARTELRVVASLLPGFSYLLLPGPMFWQQNVYFTDTAVLAPFACLLLVIASERVLRRGWAEVLVGSSFAWGFLTDWFFASVAVIFCLVRLFGVLTDWGSGQRVRRLVRELAAPVIAALAAFGFYAWQLTKHALWTTWQQKLALRTFSTGDGADAMSSNFNQVVWGSHVREQYGALGVVLIVASFVFALVWVVSGLRARRKGADAEWSVAQLNFVAVAALAPVLHTYLLKNHSYLHDFSALKFAVPLSCVPFVLFPQFVVQRFARQARVVTFACAALGVAYVVVLHQRYPGMVPARNPEIAELGGFVRESTTYQDVVYSAFTKAEPYPSEPHLLSHTLKLIHQVGGVEQLAAAVRELPADANVVWLGDSTREADPIGSAAFWGTAERSARGSFFTLRLSRDEFLARYGAAN